MTGRQAIVIATLLLIIAGCGADAEPVPSPTAAADPTPSPVPVVVQPTADPATPSPSPSPTRTPKPTAMPVPPKPTGLVPSEKNAETCYPSGICSYEVTTLTLTWEAPRTKGVEIRVYGVTTCFRPDNRQGACLRTHTALPDDVRVLLAKAPAAKGKLRWRVDGRYFDTSDGCVVGWRSENGTPVYSIVVAAYGEGGHSIFAIADPGQYWRNMNRCSPETF